MKPGNLTLTFKPPETPTPGSSTAGSRTAPQPPRSDIAQNIREVTTLPRILLDGTLPLRRSPAEPPRTTVKTASSTPPNGTEATKEREALTRAICTMYNIKDGQQPRLMESGDYSKLARSKNADQVLALQEKLITYAKKQKINLLEKNTVLGKIETIQAPIFGREGVCHTLLMQSPQGSFSVSARTTEAVYLLYLIRTVLPDFPHLNGLEDGCGNAYVSAK